MSAPAVRISALIKLALASDKDGEALGALHALRRALAALGFDHHAFAALVERALAPPVASRPHDPGDDWRALAEWCLRHDWMLDPRETDFIDTIVGYRHPPSAKQMRWLHDICGRLREEMGDRS